MALMPTRVHPDVMTLPAAFQATVAAQPEGPALVTPDGTTWTWEEYARRVREAAGGLRALGLRHGDTMACWLDNRPEFHVADTAALHLGVASFSVDQSASVALAEHLIVGAGARVVVTERRFEARVIAVRDAGRTPLRAIVCVDACTDPTLVDWDELLDCAPGGFDLEAGAIAVAPDDRATFMTISTPSEWPRGVALSHRQLGQRVAALQAALVPAVPVGVRNWLGMARLEERVLAHYAPMRFGWPVSSGAAPEPGERWEPPGASGPGDAEVRLSDAGELLVRRGVWCKKPEHRGARGATVRS